MGTEAHRVGTALCNDVVCPFGPCAFPPKEQQPAIRCKRPVVSRFGPPCRRRIDFCHLRIFFYTMSSSITPTSYLPSFAAADVCAHRSQGPGASI